MKDQTLKHNVWIHSRKLLPGVFTETCRAYKHHHSYFHAVYHYQLKALGPVQDQQRGDRHYLSAARFLCCEVQVEAQRRWSFAVMKVAFFFFFKFPHIDLDCNCVGAGAHRQNVLHQLLNDASVHFNR